MMTLTRDIGALQGIAARLRWHVVQMVGVGQKGHLGGSCSAADIVAALYFAKMRHDPADPGWPDRDRFLLSKGHSALVQYAALAESGYFPMAVMKTVKSLGSALQGHPDRLRTPGVEANTGSLGQGISIACGMAAGLRIDGRAARVYCMLGDGELAEGQVWEAANGARAHRLDNLVAILDNNGLMATAPIVQRYDTTPYPEKWRAFGWHVCEIDGHDVGAILAALDEAEGVRGRPTMIIAHTIKGKGISFAENRPEFHNGALSAAQFETACRELAGPASMPDGPGKGGGA